MVEDSSVTLMALLSIFKQENVAKTFTAIGQKRQYVVTTLIQRAFGAITKNLFDKI